MYRWPDQTSSPALHLVMDCVWDTTTIEKLLDYTHNAEMVHACLDTVISRLLLCLENDQNRISDHLSVIEILLSRTECRFYWGYPADSWCKTLCEDSPRPLSAVEHLATHNQSLVNCRQLARLIIERTLVAAFKSGVPQQHSRACRAKCPRKECSNIVTYVMFHAPTPQFVQLLDQHLLGRRISHQLW